MAERSQHGNVSSSEVPCRSFIDGEATPKRQQARDKLPSGTYWWYSLTLIFQTIFFTPLDPFNSDANEAESFSDTSKPRKVKYQTHWRPEQDAVYWIHLSTAQDGGLEFWQTGSDAIIAYQSVPKNAPPKWSAKVGRETCSRDSSHLENDPK